MFKQELVSFLYFIESNDKLDEWYLADFNNIHVGNPNYETGYFMLVDCCEAWVTNPKFTWEIISIISNIRNIISTNTFPDIFIENKQNILAIYSDIDNKEKEMFNELFKNSNIKWFS